MNLASKFGKMKALGWMLDRPLLLVAALGALIVAGWAWHGYNKVAPAPVGMSTPATVAAEVARTPTVAVALKAPVAVYAGGAKTKQKLKLPDAVVQAKTKEVLASSTIKADDHPSTVTTVLDTQTGQSETYVRRDPLPWIAFATSGEAGGYIGILNGQSAARVQVVQDFLQIKAARVSAIISADQVIGSSDTAANAQQFNTFAGVGVRYKW